jgi:hypothetical protein
LLTYSHTQCFLPLAPPVVYPYLTRPPRNARPRSQPKGLCYPTHHSPTPLSKATISMDISIASPPSPRPGFLSRRNSQGRSRRPNQNTGRSRAGGRNTSRQQLLGARGELEEDVCYALTWRQCRNTILMRWPPPRPRALGTHGCHRSFWNNRQRLGI